MTKIPKNSFGRELERLRKMLEETNDERWSQARVARSLNVSTQAYQNWVHGRRGKKIDIAAIKNLSKILQGDFIKLLRLARPDVMKHLETYKTEELDSIARSLRKKNDYSKEVADLADVLEVLYSSEAGEFYKLERLIKEIYPEATKKAQKRKPPQRPIKKTKTRI